MNPMTLARLTFSLFSAAAKRSNFSVTASVLLMLALPACAQDTHELPEVINFNQPRLGPEGVEYDALSERFLVGSIFTGSVYAVADNGEVTPFIQDEWLEGSLGIHIDRATNRLLVVNVSSELLRQEVPEGFQSGLGVYDLETGETLFQVDLSDVADGPAHLANDVTVDNEGNAYVTDFLHPVVYRVTPQGEASVLVESELLEAETFGGNGIDYHPDGYLIVAVSENASFIKVPLDRPEALSKVALDMPLLADGLLFDGTDLIATARMPTPDAQTPQEMPGVVARIVSDDNWQSASVTEIAEGFDAATTSTMRENSIYAINAYLNDPTREAYEIVRVDFAQNTGR